MKKGTITFFLIIAVLQAISAQASDTDFMRSIGKIYVVVAVIVAIFVGIVLFLIYLDRKLARLENQINNDD
jgi:CcmD family protein